MFEADGYNKITWHMHQEKKCSMSFPLIVHDFGVPFNAAMPECGRQYIGCVSSVCISKMLTQRLICLIEFTLFAHEHRVILTHFSSSFFIPFIHRPALSKLVASNWHFLALARSTRCVQYLARLTFASCPIIQHLWFVSRVSCGSYSVSLSTDFKSMKLLEPMHQPLPNRVHVYVSHTLCFLNVFVDF